MLRRWIARVLLAVLTLEAGLIGGMYMGNVGWMRNVEAAVFKGILSKFREVEPSRVILENRAEGREWHLRPLIPPEDDGPEFSLIDLRLVPELFDGDEPTAAEMAYLLRQVYESGGREIALTKPLAWESASEIELRTLDSVLGTFDSVVIPLEMSEVPRPSALPDWLPGSTLDAAGLRGDSSGIPVLNSILRSPSITPTDGISFAFPDFGARDQQYRATNRIPMLARWGNDILPSWSLAMAMEVAGMKAENLTIDPGDSLRMGDDGPIIPLDDSGSARLTAGNQTLPESLPAKNLVPIDEGDRPKLARRVIILDHTYDLGGKYSERMVREATALLGAPRPGKPEIFRRLPRIWEIALYLEIVIVAIFALYVRPINQLLSLLVLAGALLVFVIAIVQTRAMWTPVLPLVGAITMAWCLAGYLQQVAHPVAAKRKKSTDAAEGLAPEA